MSDHTCDGCKWWDAVDGNETGVCISYCLLNGTIAGHDNSDGLVLMDRLCFEDAIPLDGKLLLTHSNFGCNGWVPKDEELLN